MQKLILKFNCIIGLLCSLLISCTSHKSHVISTSDMMVNTEDTVKSSIVEKLKESYKLPISERIALYHKLKKESPESYDFKNEDQLTMYGYSLLWNNEIADAIEFFKLIVAEFPDSSNPYDSLGEAYLANGEEELSLLNYEKSLALNPDNFNAEDQIDRIKNPDKKPETPAAKFVKKLSVEAYQEDLDQLGGTLLTIHPNALKFISKKDFLRTIEEKKALVTAQTTYAEFVWHCREIIANVNCSHTSLGGFYADSEMLPTALGFPVQTRWVNGKLYVADALNNQDKITVSEEITSINGVSVGEMMRDIYKRIPSQGHIETSKRHFFNRWSTEMIPYALSFPKEFVVKVTGRSGFVTLNPATAKRVPFGDASVNYCKDDLCLAFPQKEIALLTVNSFNYYNWNNLSVFQKFVDDSFKEITKRKVKKLIIDLRLNGGGSPESSIYLLKYLTDTPFTYFEKSGYPAGQGVQQPFENSFKGKIYYLIDGNGNSTTGHFMAIVKDKKLGTIIGEELGSNQFCTAGQTVCRLANSKLVYYVANTTSKLTITSLPDEKGILPDHYVLQPISDYLQNKDTVMEYAFKLVKGSD